MCTYVFNFGNNKPTGKDAEVIEKYCVCFVCIYFSVQKMTQLTQWYIIKKYVCFIFTHLYKIMIGLNWFNNKQKKMIKYPLIYNLRIWLE